MLKFPNPHLPKIKTLGIIGKGKFGQLIEKLAHEQHIETVSVNRASDETCWSKLENAHVWIDVAHAEGLEKRLERAKKLQIPVIIGTTGLGNDLEKWVTGTSLLDWGLLVGANFNPMVSLFYHICESLYQKSRLLSTFETHIKEIHHVHKKDAPSGTALELQHRLEQLGAPFKTIESIREGDVKGTHILELTGPCDKWTIGHQSLCRESFANGALLAAQWMIGRKGFYKFQDVILDLSGLKL